MINKDIAYFDPNTFGEKGYSMIGPLLLFYSKVILYGPVGYLVEKSYENEELRSTSLTPQEFTNYIEKGVLVPLGFESFFDKDARGQLYLPELRVTTDFDRDLISSPVLATKRKVVPNDFKFNLSPHIAKNIIDNNELIKNRLLAEIKREETLPKRYKDLQQHIDLIPKQLQEKVGINDPHSLLPYVIVYDLFNNRHVMEYEGTAGIHSQHREFRGLYRAIHGLEDTTLKESQQAEIIGEILTHCVSKINYGRLTSKQIDEFRKHYRKHFILFIESALEKSNGETDFFKRKEDILNELEKKFRAIQNDLSIGFDKLISMVPPLKVLSKPISEIFYSDPGTKRNKFYHGMLQPLSLKDRWAYQFLKLRK
jgi:hypothetical protein